MKILLAGASLNSGNRGVNALTRGQIYSILDSFGIDTEIVILSYTVKNNIVNEIDYGNHMIMISEVSCKKNDLISSFIKNKSFGSSIILEEINTSDYIFDISEGDSFSDIYGYRRFLLHSLIKLMCINNNKKLIIMPQTIGPFDRTWVRMIAQRILNKADQVYVRDNLSRSYVKDELKINREINLSPDMAFYMEPSSKVNINDIVKSPEQIIVGINISALLYHGGYTGSNMFGFRADYKKTIDMLIQKFASIKDVKLILVPHVMVEDSEVEDDYRLCKKIASEFNQKYDLELLTIKEQYKEDEIKGIIKGCDFFIGSRMHACIAAISTLVPTAPIAYSRKFIGVWDDLELGFCVINPKEDSEEEIVSKAMTLFNQRKQIKSSLEYRIISQKEKILKMMAKIQGDQQ